MWLLGRVVSTIAMLLVVSVLLFTLTRLTPVSPARIVLGADATAAQISGFEQDHGLDRSIPVQFARWLDALPSEGFGKSFITGVSIDTQLAQSFPITFELVSVAFVLALAGAAVLGIVAALDEDGVLDHVTRIIAMSALSIPGFWLALLLIRTFAVRLEWFPPMGIVPLRSRAGISDSARDLF